MDILQIIKPQNAVSIVGNIMYLVWVAPTDVENRNLIFKIEFDTVDTFNSANYKYCESRLSANGNQGIWEIKNSSNEYESLPVIGIGPTYYGHDARCSIKTTDSVYPNYNIEWFFRILAGHQI
jgi:hypothetical protein